MLGAAAAHANWRTTGISTEFKILSERDVEILDNVAENVFDAPIEASYSAEFLRDPRHHLCVALIDGVVIGFASGVHYVHPDKPPQFWINEIGVAPAYRNKGIGKGILTAMLAHARKIGCSEAWVLTDDESEAARALYRSAGGRETLGVVMATFDLGGPAG
jgi:GNAT superfamily N-acetyltransferase